MYKTSRAHIYVAHQCEYIGNRDALCQLTRHVQLSFFLVILLWTNLVQTPPTMLYCTCTCSYVNQNLIVYMTRRWRLAFIIMTRTHFDLLYSNSIWRQSSMPTSILMLLLSSGYCASVWTTMSCSLTKSLNRFTTVTRKKYLQNERITVMYSFMTQVPLDGGSSFEQVHQTTVNSLSDLYDDTQLV